MQFVPHGPDIPNSLLQAHEDGRVVFFCGAGISYPAGLPDFQGLVERIYRLNNTVPLANEQEALNRKQFDTALDLLERRLPGQRQAVRRKLKEALRPNLRKKGSTETHTALLQLAHNRDGSLRLVTTNFDRMFHASAKRTGDKFREHTAPILPIPKKSRWNGIAFLHGLLPIEEDETLLNHLVLTSGDFGLAYLTERWASRFVSELFRNYVVCFVGYSINDPVLRYMMDALAADRMLGEETTPSWALGDCEPGQEQNKTNEWETKGVTPILYRVPVNGRDHSALHKTLHAWASTYHDGVLGKESIVVEHALATPSASTMEDDFVGRMLWALSDKSGLPARRFADFNPVPSLEWLLDVFSRDDFRQGDLPRFNVTGGNETDTTLQFSLVCRPSPSTCAPPMQIVSGNSKTSAWDPVMNQIARWLTRHLDDPRLILWIAQNGGKVDHQWSSLIESTLRDIYKNESGGKSEELSRIRAHAPNAIPRHSMRTLWSLVLSGRVKSTSHNHNLYRWKDRIEREGMTTPLRLELRELLAPKVAMKKPFRWGIEEETAEDSQQSQHLVRCELVLASDHVRSILPDAADAQWSSVLPQLLEDFQILVRDALDLLHVFGEADHHYDPSHRDLPSIEPHQQNKGFREWICLIELLRDAWLAIREDDNTRAAKIAIDWASLPYPTYKRLALFAASREPLICPADWVSWLLSDEAWPLWSTDTGREVFRVLVRQGKNLKGKSQASLEAAILAGPPRKMYRADLDQAEWQEDVDRTVWLRLAKLSSSGLELGSVAAKRLAELSHAHPEWRLESNESDEFSHWISGTDDPDFKDRRHVDIAPRTRRDLVRWLRNPVEKTNPFYEDTWRDVCRTRFFHSLCALCDLGQNGIWPIDRWREALQTWAEKGMETRSWRYAAPLVQRISDANLRKLINSVTWWIKTISKSIDQHDHILLELCQRVLSLPLESDTGMIRNGQPIDQPLTEALNHPVGHVTEALINFWLIQKPKDGDLVPENFRPVFTMICDTNVEHFRHGRVLLSSRLIALFRIDPAWTTQHLLPLLQWENPCEAKAIWDGFLWSPRLYQPLLAKIKPQLLNATKYYRLLGEHRRQFAAFLTYAALGSIEGYSVEEFREAIGTLPQDGLEECAQAAAQALEGAANKHEEYWKNRIQPFWQEIWPKSLNLITPGITEALARMVIAARGEFPAALSAVKDWLQPIDHTYYLTHLLRESELCSRFPSEALHYLDRLIGDQQWPSEEVKQCLDTIKESAPALAQDTRFQRIQDYWRRRSG